VTHEDRQWWDWYRQTAKQHGDSFDEGLRAAAAAVEACFGSHGKGGLPPTTDELRKAGRGAALAFLGLEGTFFPPFFERASHDRGHLCAPAAASEAREAGPGRGDHRPAVVTSRRRKPPPEPGDRPREGRKDASVA
jgi:hypothetical protein